MATTEVLLARQLTSRKPERSFDRRSLAATAALTAVALLVHGYHPYAEDGGLYLPGILKLVHPQLYPSWTGFVTAQTQYSLFARTVAALVRSSGISVMASLLGTYILSIWTLLFAAWQIVWRCSDSRKACYAGVTVLSLCLTIPVAGTSLILFDPYVTARTISTPFSLLAVLGATDVLSEFKQTSRVRWQSVALCLLSLLVASLMHPLMAAYAAGYVILLACSSIKGLKIRLMAFSVVALFSVSVAFLLDLLASPRPAGYAQVALTRHYWFLGNWRWFEVVGLVAPLIVLLAVTKFRGALNERARWLAQAAVSAGSIGLVVALLFARETAQSYLVAMLQPLRIFLMIYLVMMLLVSTTLAQVLLKRSRLLWSALCVGLAVLMSFAQFQTFSHSSHFEFPGTDSHNDWGRAFLWIRDNTPTDAIFALDANYITSQGEDAQSFRAIAERSTLPDYAKDGGIAAIEPDLTSEWITGEMIQANLASLSDIQRRSELVRAGIHWTVLPRSTITALPCPYVNPSVRVCRVPDR